MNQHEEITEKIQTIGGYSKFVKLPLDWIGDAKSVIIKRAENKLIIEVENDEKNS